MGRKLNTSTPTVIQTMLTPLSDTFLVTPSDSLEQWFYVNTGEYSPDRTIATLLLTPSISAVDPDTGTLYTPSFTQLNWYYFDASNSTDYSSDTLWPGLGWVPVYAVAYEEGGVYNDYYCPSSATNPSRSLYVKKNVPPASSDSSGSATVLCVAQYADPRDSGVTVTVRASTMMTTSKDATTDELTINLNAPTKATYNPIVSQSSIYTITAEILKGKNVDVTSSYYIEWYGKLNGSKTEVLINTLLCYTQATQESGKGQGTDTIKLDAMFAEHIDIVCRVRRTSTSAILPAVAYCAILWEFPKLDPYTVCKNGRGVNSNARDLTFETIINYKGGVVTDEQKIALFLLNYKRRISSSSEYVDMGWGLTVTENSNNLRQTTTYSTPVMTDVYMLGAYEEVTDDDEVVTDDGDVVYDNFV